MADQRSQELPDLQVTLHAHAANLGALEAIIENLTEGVSIASPEGKLLVMNPEALRQHGFRDVEEARRDLPRFAEIFELRAETGEPLPVDAMPLVRAMRGERFTEFEVEVRRRDTGAAWYISYSGTPIYREDGTIRLGVVTSRNVTARRQAEAARLERDEQFRLIVASAPNGIVVVDPEGRIALANAQAERTFGYAPGELLGLPVEVLVPERFRGVHADQRNAFMAGPQARPMGAGRDLFGRCKDGSEFPVEIGLAPLRMPDKTLFLATVVDITERKRAEGTIRFLAQASFVLARSLDYETTLASVADLVVPEYADWCGIDLLDDDGRLQPVTVAHVDPAKVAWARELRQRYPTDMNAPSGAPNVVRTGRSEFYPEISEALLQRVSVDEEHYRLVKEVGMRSAIVAPLVARGRTLGTITLVLSETGRRYGERDLMAIEELARMCALAVDNARLYGEAQREIEERRRAEEEIERLNRDLLRRLEELQAILDVSPIGFGLGLDASGHDIRPNPALAAMLGVAPYRNVSMSNPETGADLPFRVYREGRALSPGELPAESAVRRRGPVEGETFDVVHRDGRRLTLLAYASPLFDETGAVRGSVGAFVDITRLKETEQQLKQLNETLEQRVAARTADLERANRELQVSNRELQEFAYVASHDLQEPLRKIHSFADLLAAEHGSTLDADAHTYLERIQQSARRMSTLISDLLAFSRVQTSGDRFQEVDLGLVVEEALQDLEEAVRTSGAGVTVGALPRIEADALQMRQLFQNLIGNALKYRRPGVAPEVTIRGRVEARTGAVRQAKGPVAVLEIEDNGIGFEEKYLDRIFTPFQRLHARGEYAGTGMGLAICRRIVDRHGGTLTARSTPGAGSRFIVTLPRHQAGTGDQLDPE